MNETETRQAFKRAVIMGNHPGCTYEEALEKENPGGWNCPECLREYDSDEKSNGDTCGSCGALVFEYLSHPLPLTIGRVLQAIKNTHTLVSIDTDGEILNSTNGDSFVGKWKFTNKGTECTDDDQTLETIFALLDLLTK